MVPERRLSARRTFNKTISLERSNVVSDQFRNSHYEGLVMDISNGGLGLSTNDRLKEGEIVKLFLPLKEMDITVPVMAEVKWSRRATLSCQAGLKFLG